MNEIRIGRISSINYKDGTARVVYKDRDGSVTKEIPFLRAEYNMPAVGELVLVAHLSNGQEAGVILGRPWSDKNRPAEGFKGLYRKELSPTPGRATIRYDDGTGELAFTADSITLNGETLASILQRISHLEEAIY